jgi:cation diffusion facilitator CzcD-associated flavoprotein CzcO
VKVDVLIAGAGFSGLCMAIQLRRKLPELTVLIVEKGHDVGGTWYENHYPGCACDIPSHLYSFSFERNAEWTRMFAAQPEIQTYLKHCVQKYGLTPHIRLGTRLSKAVWDEAALCWRAVTEDGLEIEAQSFVSGVGALHVPNYPDLPGIEHFQGPAFHSAHWDHSVDLAGKNVAVIGTGASSIQFVPEIAKQAGRLQLFQRTPAWILPRLDFPIAKKWKERFRKIPVVGWAFRQFIFWLLEIRVLGFLGNLWMRKQGAKMAQHHLEKQVADHALRAALTPHYEMGCKRVLISSDFYPTLTRPNVDLVTSAIRQVTAHNIVTTDGQEHPIDVVIFATGFKISDILHDVRVAGRNGSLLSNEWRERPRAFFGITLSGFPNLFLLLGPNTGLGHNSVVLMIEAQVQYVVSCLKLLRKTHKRALELRKGKLDSFIARIDQRLTKTVWQAGGCRSWYQDQNTGKNIAIWPGSVIEYIWRTRRAAADDYQLTD